MPHRSIPLGVMILLALAALACSVSVSTTRFEDAKLYKTTAGEDPTRSFKPDDTVYCIMELKNVEGETAVRVAWKQVEDSAGEVAETDLGDETYDAPNGRLVMALTPPEGGWPKGRYSVDLYLAGDKKETLEFAVK